MELGRPGDAVIALRQEVDVYAGLSAVNAALVRPYLAGALSTLALALAQVGRHEDALDTAQQAVGIFRASRSDLTAQQEIFEAMTEIGALYQAGRGADVRAVTERLVRRHPRLADIDQLVNVNPRAVSAQRTAATDGGLAGALYLAGDELAHLGRYQEALAPTEEAVAIFRRLKESHPADFGGWLGRALDSLAATLTALSRHDPAGPGRTPIPAVTPRQPQRVTAVTGSVGAFGQALPVQDEHRFRGQLEPAAGGEVGERLVDRLP